MRLRSALLVLLSLYIPTTLAEEVDLSPDYLAGTWSMAGSEGCGSADYVLFRENGTVELGRGKAAGIAGFWELNNDTIILHMLVAPRGGQARHAFYQDSYFYQYRAAQVLQTRADVIEVRVGEPGEHHTLTRCR
ncbi:MAG: hypothetical protein PVI91_00145 [Gammaproteobacteria bacterium]|jgi:hypothetical protein